MIKTEKTLAILGATGSIGRNALDVARNLNGDLKLVGASARGNASGLAEIAGEFGIGRLALADENAAASLRGDSSVSAEVYSGPEAASTLVRECGADIILSGISGADGLSAGFEAVRLGKRLALANKETMVMAGGLLLETARETGAEIIPVDSEHSAVFQAMKAGRSEEVKRVILTASGGPFRNSTFEEMEHATPGDALKHPTWNMGRKISVDSATMMNKALEVIEACVFFELPPEKVDVIVHPESIVHSMVEFVDGSTIAHMGPADMRVPIQYSLTCPDRRPLNVESLDLAALGSLRFEKVDTGRFRAVDLAYAAARMGGTAPTVLNAANEVAVKLFLDGKIKFTDIADLVASALESHSPREVDSLETVYDADREARSEVVKCTG